MRVVAVVLVTLAATLGATAPARADILAVTEVPSPAGTDLDIALLNASTGARSPLPAGVNTTADEFHPSLSPDGKRIVFARVDRRAGTNRIILVDRSTGQSADLFNAFEAASDLPTTPSFVGSQVVVGNQIKHDQSSQDPDHPSFSWPDLANFPSGPFTKTRQVLVGLVVATRGDTSGPVGGPGGLRATTLRSDLDTFFGASDVLLFDGSSLRAAAESFGYLLHPAISAATPHVVVFERAGRSGNPIGNATLSYKPAVVSSFAAAPAVQLPAIVNAPGLDESRPAFTANGRYLAFVRRAATGHDRLLVFDTQTQTLLYPAGVDLGALDRSQPIGQLQRYQGNVSPALRSLFVHAQLTAAGFPTGSMLQIADVELMVQRIVGRHKLLGRRVPKLRLVGRVALGPHGRGEIHIKWDRRVHGRRLKPGRYLVTPRAVTSKAVVRELGKPRVIRVRRRG